MYLVADRAIESTEIERKFMPTAVLYVSAFAVFHPHFALADRANNRIVQNANFDIAYSNRGYTMVLDNRVQRLPLFRYS